MSIMDIATSEILPKTYLRKSGIKMPKHFLSVFTTVETVSTHNIVSFTYHFSRLIGPAKSARVVVARKSKSHFY